MTNLIPPFCKVCQWKVWIVMRGSSDTGSPSVFLWLVAKLEKCQSANLNFVAKLYKLEKRVPLIFLFFCCFSWPHSRNIYLFVSSFVRPQVFVMLGISGKHFRVVSRLDSEDEVTEEIINELETRQNSMEKTVSIFQSFKFHL